MTAQEILAVDVEFKTERGWLREIAYQLAKMNEAREVVAMPIPQTVTHDVMGKRGARR